MVVVFFVLILLIQHAASARVAEAYMAMTRAMTGRRLKRLLGRAGLYFSVLMLNFLAILFFLWMLSLVFKNEADSTAVPPVFIPNPPTFDNFIDVFAKSNFLTYTINSVIVSLSATGLALLLEVPAGYGIARAKASKAAVLILMARVNPGLSYLIPLFQWLGLIGTLVPLLITHLVIMVPIVVWIMVGVFEGLPAELEEAALVDGATIGQAFRYVAMLRACSGITVAMILAFIFSWNNFIFGVVLAGRATRTLPVAVYNVRTFEPISLGPLAAAPLVVTAPVLPLTLRMQKEIVVDLRRALLTEVKLRPTKCVWPGHARPLRQDLIRCH